MSILEKKKEAQVSSIQFRRNILEHQRQNTYQHEYERVRNHMVVHGMIGLRSQGHRERLNHFKKVAQALLERSHHPIHKPKGQFD